MNPSWQNIHRSFRLNGLFYSRDTLKEVAYSLVKEGMDFEKDIGDFLLDWCSNKDFVEVPTSGSTGTPKKIPLQKSQMVNSALATGQYFNLAPGNSALLCLPVTNIAGKMMLVRAMVLGLHLYYVKPSSQPLQETNKTYDFCAMVPLQAEKSLEELSRIQTLILGGAPISYALEERLQKQHNRIFATYGMTETITHIAVRQICPQNMSSFELLTDVQISQDDRNCLIVDAPKISDIEVVTNDIVELISEASFIWLGRYDNVINSGGVKLIPEQIEAKLSPLISTRFFVTGIPHETLGEKLVLILEGNIPKENKIIASIRNENLLDKFEIPKEVFVVEKFTETKTGKVNRGKTMNTLKSSLP
ncbi:MAG: AMP-binding protein [Bacteroidota bacterium]